MLLNKKCLKYTVNCTKNNLVDRLTKMKNITKIKTFNLIKFCVCISAAFVFLLKIDLTSASSNDKVANGSNSTTSGRSKRSDVEQQFSEWAGKQFASRMLWMTHQRRFVLPKGTILQLTPKVTVPVFRHAPYNGGFDSDIQASWTFYMKFDKLNMTSDDHPWPFDRPPFYPFGEMMRPNVPVKNKDKDNDKDGKESSSNKDEKVVDNYYEHYKGPKPFPNIKHVGESEEVKSMHTVNVKNYYPAFASFSGPRPRPLRPGRKPRSVMSLPPPESISGGERAIILPSIEGLLSSIGFQGRDCLLRAVCEIHEYPLGTGGYGLFGELVTLFFSISASPYAESHMPEYLKAEESGKHGDCSAYLKNCTKSIFVWEPRPDLNFAQGNDDNNSKDNAI